MDGPITANNPAGVHHGHGRTLKDVFQRYKALRGFDQRYQNGFDSQGLWVEVEVEKSLGLGSKREIEEYGLAEFAAKCRERVAHYSEVMTEQFRRLGQWMDWDNDYYTFSDTNIEYIWGFLKTVDERGWLYKGHRSTQWCPRCGTSLSQHEQAGEENYVEMEHPSLFVRFPLVERPDEALVIWTTTPWTLPANVAAAVKPDAEYGLTTDGRWIAVRSCPDEKFVRTARGEELVGLEYSGPFDELEAQAGVVHRVIPWDEVSLEEGTGIVHIAPGAGSEDFELSRVHDLPVLAPIDEAGRMLPPYGEFAGFTTTEVATRVTEALRERGILVSEGTIVHRYPICWRCKTPLVFRVVDDWFISAGEIRQPMLDANATVEWTPPQYKKRMDDWLRNMGDWNISRKRYFGLPLPFYPCECGHLNVIGSRAELEERAVSGLDQLQELHRPWIDAVRIRCAACDGEVERIVEVGDAWLDAGIVHFSTLGWNNPTWIEHGYATGASAGLSRRRPARSRLLGEVVPGRLGVGDARADPALVLLAVLHGRDADRRVAVPAGARRTRRCSTSTGRRCTSRPATRSSWTRRSTAWAPTSCAGSTARRRRASRCASATRSPTTSSARFLTFWNSVEVLRRLREHRRLPAVVVLAERRRRARSARPLARRADARIRADRRGRIRALRHRDCHARVRHRTRTIFRTGTSGGRDAASGRASAGRVPHALVRAGADAARAVAGHATRHRSPVACARARTARSPSISQSGPRSMSQIERCSRRSSTCAASSRSRTRRERPRDSSCDSRCDGSSSRAHTGRSRMPTRSPTRCGSRTSPSIASTPSCA